MKVSTANPLRCPRKPNGFLKISPGEFLKAGAMQGGGAIFETPPLPFFIYLMVYSPSVLFTFL